MKKIAALLISTMLLISCVPSITVFAGETADENESVNAVIYILTDRVNNTDIKNQVLEKNGEMLPGPLYEAVKAEKKNKSAQIVESFVNEYLSEDAEVFYSDSENPKIGVRMDQQELNTLEKSADKKCEILSCSDSMADILRSKKPEGMKDDLYLKLAATMEDNDVSNVPIQIVLKDKTNEALKAEVASMVADDLTGESYDLAFRNALYEYNKARICEFTENNLKDMNGTVSIGENSCRLSFALSGFTKAELLQIAEMDEVLEMYEVLPAEDKDEPLAYEDLPADSNWAFQGICFCIRNGIMQSTENGKLVFEPKTKVSRAMVATILYRMAGSPGAEYKASFSDVKEGKWYSEAIEWCAENEIARGKGDGKFDPNGDVTRQELAVFMMRMADAVASEENADDMNFEDMDTVSSWAAESIRWAVNTGLINGKSTNGKVLIAPNENATRAEVATIIMRFMEKTAR